MSWKVLVGSTAGLDQHDTGPGHPERRSRLEAVDRGIADVQLGGDLVRLEPRPAERNELARVHDPRYLDAVERFANAGGGALDPDTVASSGPWTTALYAAGSALAALEGLRRGTADAALMAVAPPADH